MVFRSEIETQLHEARLANMEGKTEASLQLFTNILNKLESHMYECEGEELTWTRTCYNYTLDEFSHIHSAFIKKMNTQFEESTVDVIVSDSEQTTNEESAESQFTKECVEHIVKDVEKLKSYYVKSKEGLSSYYTSTAKPAIKKGYEQTLKWCNDRQIKDKSKKILLKTGRVLKDACKEIEKMIETGFYSVYGEEEGQTTEQVVSSEKPIVATESIHEN